MEQRWANNDSTSCVCWVVIYIIVFVSIAKKYVYIQTYTNAYHSYVIYWVIIHLPVDIFHIVVSELKDPICHSNECQIGSFSSVATIYNSYSLSKNCKYFASWLTDIYIGVWRESTFISFWSSTVHNRHHIPFICECNPRFFTDVPIIHWIFKC